MANEICGTHLIVDGQVHDSKVFEKTNLENLLKTLVTNLEMKLIWGPEFLEVGVEPEKLTGDSFRDEGGTSGFCMINKSHIAIHVWPLRKFFYMDICSCDIFNTELALETITSRLQVEFMNVQQVKRSQNTNEMVRL